MSTFNGILKIARMKAGALDLPLSNVDLVEVVEELVDLYQVFAEESGVFLEAQLPQSSANKGNLFVLGDAHLISQAAANLLDNAIKYTPPAGRVVIAVVQTANSVSLTIAANGPGIPTEMRPAILDPYVRGEAANGKPGFGLGLSFVSAVMEWHGAQLALVDNMPGLRATLLFPGVTMRTDTVAA